MILADTSVWVAHLRAADPLFAARLNAGEIATHPFVIGELAMGNLGRRAGALQFLDELPKAVTASDIEVLALVEGDRLHGLGIGIIDAHLLASCRLTPAARLWSRDRRLHEAAERLSLAVRPTQ
ncbi:MAG: type II toxin-antitoxin system VapC family toxin [Caulobacter sp.]